MKVLIPAAKVVEKELQSIGMLPAIIYPINKKLSLIICIISIMQSAIHWILSVMKKRIRFIED